MPDSIDTSCRLAAGSRPPVVLAIMITDAMVAALQTPARFKHVESDDTARAARMLAELL
jgi:hypothetical protein